ncbi:MAG: N-acyl homoserine lactonase family protein [Colwellia sp.]|nr:N-acyl homoserine lactonase family protein [Colwellia sp.]
MRKLIKVTVTLISVLLLSNCSSAVKESPALKLYVFDCGEITVKDISLFSPGVDIGKSKTLANACYLIMHPKGNLLWETGLSDRLVTMKKGKKIADGMFHLQVNHTLSSQLNNLGLQAKDIDYVALSHLHFDHTGNTNLFVNAKVLIQQQELDLAFTKEGEKLYFDASTYNEIDKSNFIGLDGKKDIFNDGSVVIYPAGGHTPGHQTLLVNLAGTGSVMLSGDLFHFTKNRLHKRIPALNFNKADSLSSIDNIEQTLIDVDAKLWIQHDLETFKSMKLSPEYYQ